MMTHALSLALKMESSWELLGLCPDLQNVRRLVARGHRANSIIISGETGTGKEHVARAIHEKSGCPEAPFVVANCGDLDADLVSSTLFGHEQGAFTGASKLRVGLCEEAEGGTLFLDEVGELPLEVQPKFLRVLQGYPFRRLGGKDDITPNFRVIAASNKNLQEQVKKDKFRDDLLYRLNEFHIEVPPLSLRKNDVIPLAKRFVRIRAGDTKALSQAAINFLKERSWPGNIRELEHLIYRGIIMSPDTKTFLEPEDFLSSVVSEPQVEVTSEPPETKPGIVDVRGLTLHEAMVRAQRTLILSTYEATQAHQGEMLKALGIGQATLYRKMQELKLPLHFKRGTLPR